MSVTSQWVMTQKLPFSASFGTYIIISLSFLLSSFPYSHFYYIIPVSILRTKFITCWNLIHFNIEAPSVDRLHSLSLTLCVNIVLVPVVSSSPFSLPLARSYFNFISRRRHEGILVSLLIYVGGNGMR